MSTAEADILGVTRDNMMMEDGVSFLIVVDWLKTQKSVVYYIQEEWMYLNGWLRLGEPLKSFLSYSS